MTEHTSSIGPTGGGKTPAGDLCPKCFEKHEQCAAQQTCDGWETSEYVCRMFGIRVKRPRRRGVRRG